MLEDPTLHIIWQTGGRYYAEFRDSVPEHERLTILEYIDRMPLTLAAADLAVCRSGASTCSELEVTGTPAILVPSPNVADDHQAWNAKSLVEDGGAVLLHERELDSRLLDEVRSLIGDAVVLSRMSRVLKYRARPNAARDIATDIIRLAKGQ
jgi:UDP-N-acetylglucosamine--N-acetylmuramyl-(pentapeptide) pyrophosphoryl-undecaprenol N-acetylglucosamine transferase